MRYRTLRNVEGVDRGNHKSILELCDKEMLQSRFESYVGENIVVLTKPSFSKNDEIIKGNFRGGVLRGVEFYNTGRNSGAHIWFKKGSFATGMGDVYDVMFMDWVKRGRLDKLKFFNFYGFVDGKLEPSTAFHVDPFLAYVSLRHEKKGSSDKQTLKSVGLPERGKVL
ncbi:hypothetical protein K8R30_04480 [archaeon]|nr:hypothetical protein [archaeon]